MKDFFLDKFEYDFHSNQNWISLIENNEDAISPFVEKSISHIINVHHIWNSRLLQKLAESDSWDLLPISYLIKLNELNFQETVDFIEKFELDNKINYHSSEGVQYEKAVSDILYHMLNHSNYHRAQIVMDLKNHNLPVPYFNFITYR